MIHAAFLRHPFLRRNLILIAMLPLLAACDQRGLSGRDAEWSRQRSDGFRVIQASHEGAVIDAQGQRVMVNPAPGFCLAEDSIETSKRSAFLLIGDCAVEAPTGNRQTTNGELELPKAVPGIMTVSISGDPGFRSEDGSYAGLLEFLKSPEGRAMLGRSGSGRGIEIKESREVDGALMLYLENNSTDVVPILSTRFWRAFIELHGRLAVVTMSGFRDRPLGRERMFDYLVSQVQTLGVANVAPPETPETRLAVAETATDDASDSWVRALSEIRAKARAAGATTGAAGATGAGATPAAGGTLAATPASVPEIRRGTSRIERIMVLPPPRLGSSRPAARVADRPKEVTTSGGRPASAGAAPAKRSPEPDAGPATRNAPKSAPLAPKRRR